jgi:hypothetical protein
MVFVEGGGPRMEGAVQGWKYRTELNQLVEGEEEEDGMEEGCEKGNLFSLNTTWRETMNLRDFRFR